MEKLKLSLSSVLVLILIATCLPSVGFGEVDISEEIRVASRQVV